MDRTGPYEVLYSKSFVGYILGRENSVESEGWFVDNGVYSIVIYIKRFASRYMKIWTFKKEKQKESGLADNEELLVVEARLDIGFDENQTCKLCFE